MEKIRNMRAIEAMTLEMVMDYAKSPNVDVYTYEREGMPNVDIYITKGFDHEFIYNEVVKDIDSQDNPDNIIGSVAIIPDNFKNGDPFGVSHRRDLPPFERIRRITGYLVGSLDRFNDAKYAETSDRVKHGFNPKQQVCPESERFRDYVDRVREEKGFSPIDWE